MAKTQKTVVGRTKKLNTSTDDAVLSKMPRRRSLFWDVDPKTVDPKKHARYIIERIFEYGTDSEARWMWHAYPKSLLHEIAKNARVLRPRTKLLWEALTK
jgi:hypothetical protein